jgi:lactam utilization protein B
MQPAMRDSNRCRMHFGHARKLKTHGRLTIQAEEERKQQRALLKEMKTISQELGKMGINHKNS